LNLDAPAATDLTWRRWHPDFQHAILERCLDIIQTLEKTD